MLLSYLQLIPIGLSFAGLCGFTRRQFGIESEHAPLTVCCGIIVLLMLAGYIGVLRWMRLALYALGLGAFAYNCFKKKTKIEPLPLLFLTALVLLNLIAYRGAGYSGNDSYAHWGIVVKHLVSTNRFPDAAADYIHFPNYPLGSSVFIYFCCGMTAEESVTMTALFLLRIAAFLPMLKVIRRNRLFGALLAAAMLCASEFLFVSRTALQVDVVLPTVTFGGSAILLQRRQSGQSLLSGCVISCLICASLVAIKSSGIFFALILCAVFFALHRKEKHALSAVIACLLASAAFRVLWSLHFRIHFAQIQGLFHEETLDYWLRSLSDKTGKASPAGIAANMLTRLIKPDLKSVFVIAGGAVLILLSVTGKRFLMEEELSEILPSLPEVLIFCAAVYIIWYFLLYLTYLFSMTKHEAEILMCISRYEGSALILIGDILTFYALTYCCGSRSKSVAPLKQMILPAAGCLLAVSALIVSGGANEIAQLFADSRASSYDDLASVRKACDQIVETDPDSKYLILFDANDRPFHLTMRHVKYELMTNNMLFLSRAEKGKACPCYVCSGFSPTCQTGTLQGFDDLQSAFLSSVEGCDYILALKQSEAFDDLLESCEIPADTRILFGYDVSCDL